MTRKEKQQKQSVAEQAEMGQEIFAHIWGEWLTKHFEELAVGSSNLESSSVDFYQKLLTLETTHITAITEILAKQNPEMLRESAGELYPFGKDRKPESSPSIELLLKALRIAGSTQKLAEWIQTPVPALNGERPYTLMQSEEGCKQVDTVLSRIEHGVY